MISSENLSFLLGVNVFCGETIIPKGTRGSQLSFKFTIRVEPRRRKIFTEALKNLGYDTNESDKISGDVKCRFSPLFRKITTDIQFKLPSWASDTDISNLIPALFANAWEENLEGDKIALEILSGQK